MKRVKKYKKGMLCFLAVILISISSHRVWAQVGTPLEECHKIQEAYMKVDFLSYNVAYSYTPEKKPDSTYFSGKGSFKLSQSDYYGTIDSTLYMQNSLYAVMVTNANRVMHISKPDNIFPAISSMAVFDSLVQLNSIKYSITTKGRNRQIVFDFSMDPSLGYKDFRIEYDAVTYWIMAVSYTIVAEDEEDNLPPGQEKYITAKSVYSNYSTKPFDKAIFNSDNYFVMDENGYKTQSNYAGYEIFIASPELIKN